MQHNSERFPLFINVFVKSSTSILLETLIIIWRGSLLLVMCLVKDVFRASTALTNEISFKQNIAQKVAD